MPGGPPPTPSLTALAEDSQPPATAASKEALLGAAQESSASCFKQVDCPATAIGHSNGRLRTDR